MAKYHSVDMFHTAIDFGTTNTVVYTVVGEELREIDILQGKPLVPTILVPGKEEITWKTSSNKEVHCIKLLLGRPPKDLEFCGLDTNKFGAELVEQDREICVKDGEKTYPVTDMVSTFFKQIKKLSEGRLRMKSSDKLYLSVPTRFNSPQRNALVKATNQAGFTEVHLINEPTAAALGYIKDFNLKSDETVLVYDFGGGTFDVSILRLSNQGTNISVIATGGDNNTGGERIDYDLGQKLVEQFKSEHPNAAFKNRERNRGAYGKFEKSVCGAKESMTADSQNFTISFGDILTKKTLEEMEEEEESTSIELTASMLDEIEQKYVDKSMEIVRATLHRAFPTVPLDQLAEKITMVLPVGGASSMTCVKQSLTDYFGKEKVKIVEKPKWLTVRGCAYMMKGEQLTEITVRECTSYDYGFRCSNDSFECVIPKGTSIPLEKPFLKLFKTRKSDQTIVRTYLCEGDAENSKEINKSFTSEEIEIDISLLKQKEEKCFQFYLSLGIDGNGIFEVEALTYPEKDIFWKKQMEMNKKYECGSKR